MIKKKNQGPRCWTSPGTKVILNLPWDADNWWNIIELEKEHYAQ
jgi:hypothetical protein